MQASIRLSPTLNNIAAIMSNLFILLKNARPQVRDVTITNKSAK